MITYLNVHLQPAFIKVSAYLWASVLSWPLFFRFANKSRFCLRCNSIAYVFTPLNRKRAAISFVCHIRCKSITLSILYCDFICLYSCIVCLKSVCCSACTNWILGIVAKSGARFFLDKITKVSCGASATTDAITGSIMATFPIV